jgi:hypothetical protein
MSVDPARSDASQHKTGIRCTRSSPVPFSLLSDRNTKVNAEMHANENRSAILRIQNEFTHAVNFVAPSRKFVRQGTLVKKCRSSDKTYEFFLFNDLLVR